VNVHEAVTFACERIPGLIRGALMFLPEGFVLVGVGDADALDLEPLIRAAARCLGAPVSPTLRGAPRVATEYLFVVHEQLVAIQRSAHDPRLALAVACASDLNPGFALGASRLAMRDIEATVDLSSWGL
jgi:hypothetical protein